MKLLLPLLLATSSFEGPGVDESPSFSVETVFHKISEGAIYLTAGALFGSASLLTRVGWEICHLSPWAASASNECLLLSDLFGIASGHAFDQLLKGVPSFEGKLASQSSWHHNQDLLSRVPISTKEDIRLVEFLKKRWLAKSTGFYRAPIDWVYPSFGIFVQLHPESTSSYARDPNNKLSQTYENRVEAWKQSLPHPHSFPLILTRLHGVENYLPSYLNLSTCETPQQTHSKVILDVTDSLSSSDQEKWLDAWKNYQGPLLEKCQALHLQPEQIICIQKLQQEEIGGIRILPLASATEDEISKQYLFLLEWVSKFGLSANRVELDRWDLPSNIPIPTHANFLAPCKEKFLSSLGTFEQSWSSSQPHKTLMLQGTLQVIKGLFAHLPENKWQDILHNKTQSSIVQICFLEIEEQLKLLAKEEKEDPFFNMVSHLEQMHASISSLLEIASPYKRDDFPQIYQNLLISHPSQLKDLTSCAIHSAGMTSLAGIIKATERSLNRPPRVLYGENTYYENIYSSSLVSKASAMEDATEEDWTEADLLLAQFNPALKRINFVVTNYQPEKVSQALHKSLICRGGRPLTLALDCTLDYIDSPRVGALLHEFQEEIINGSLNVICYRSGLKFDLFGMDNYSGAPLYMIHNEDPKWDSFTTLLNDPALLADRLSHNWFCLAYQNVASQLELYRKQIFENTRALLSKAPAGLFDQNARYRIVPIGEKADPSFIDIKISGPWHEIRTSILVGGYMFMKSMENGHPLFFRPSLGFYHPNISILFAENCSTIRLTLGLDPAQVDVLASCFEMIHSLN